MVLLYAKQQFYIFKIKRRGFMKKRIISLLITFAMVSTCVLPAIAASGFDREVMRNGADICIEADEMEGYEGYIVESLKKEKYTSNSALIQCFPMVVSQQDADFYDICIKIYTLNRFPVDEVIFKVGNHRYVFSQIKGFDCGDKKTEDVYNHTLIFMLDSYSLTLIDDIVKNQNQDVKVRIKGNDQNLDFTLSNEMKDAIINLYNLYAQAGGLRESNINVISDMFKSSGATLIIYED